MHPTSHAFPENARAELGNPTLQRALGMARTGFPARRAQAVARLPEFEALREEGRAIKDHTLAHLDFYLELYERNVEKAGGQVHWARNADEAREAVLDICRSAGAKIVTKGKSMVAEEIALNDHLEANGITPVETDLGEYIIQLRHEPPSHIIAPAIHLMKEQVAETFRAAHRDLDPGRPLDEPRDLCDEARTVLRPEFLAADVGITGANFLIAETGSSIIVTNEGNGDLTQILPRVHIVVTSIEKVVPTLEDAATLLRLLGALGDGPGIFVLYDALDRAAPAGRCRRAGAVPCRAARQWPHRPVGRRVPGHAALPALFGLPQPLSGLCGGRRACLWLGLSRADGGGADPGAGRIARGRAPAERLDLLRALRERLPGQDPAAENDAALARARIRPAPEPARLPLRPAAMGMAGGAAGAVSRFRQFREPRRSACSAAGAAAFAICRSPTGWTSVRDMPAPEGRSFQSLWAERQRDAGPVGHGRARRHTRRHPPGAAARSAAARNAERR